MWFQIIALLSTFFSPVVSEVIERLASAAVQVGYSLLWSLEDDLSALENTFRQVQDDLHDTEMRQSKGKGVVEVWLKRLKSASLEAENLLDEAKTEAMIQRVHREMGKRLKLLDPLMGRIRIWRIAHKVNNIREKLDENTSKFDLTASNTTSKDDADNNDIRESCSLKPLEEEIIGRDENTNMIVDTICNQEIGIRRDINHVRVYAIWGMGGIGKTTLAQYVYNHPTVKTHFDLKCWVYVSAVFDKKRIIKLICGLEDKKLDEMSLDALVRQLQSMLNKKKCFIIMDDVWLNHDSHEDMEKWEQLCTALSCGAKGSTVMVTTRKEDLAKRMAIPELQHNVAVLSEEESWSLFKLLAFSGRGEAENVSSELELIGKQIVEKCNGLPLAVKSLGSLMSTKKKVNEWRTVNKHFKSKIQGDVLPALRLSYDDLPPYMKICFAYCCVFSKGEELSKDTLIELWMANGFIPSQDDGSLYELGEEIFDCLVGRSFFQDVVEEDIETGVICKMHDLMHDLALDVMGDDCAAIGPGKESITPDEVLHLSLSCKDFMFSKQDLEKLRSLRSMLVFYYFYKSNIRQIISSHVYLRVLYLNGIESSTLPESICKLIHLRYLKIEDSGIEVLPDSIMYLQNLQVLIIRSGRFRELPKGLRYMRNLQRLDTGIQHMPVGIKELTNLRRLSQFAVGKDEGARIGELGNLNLLGWGLNLSNLENVGGLRDAKSANLKDKTNLKSLRLKWGRIYLFLSKEWGIYHKRQISDSEEVLEGLEPNSGLQELSIWNYDGRVMSPSWMVKLVNLTSIKLHNHENCEQLPPLGKLGSLQIIEFIRMDSLECFHDDDYVTSRDGNILFPNLQKLNILACGSLVSLPSNFPKLRSLRIDSCDNLRSLPDQIQSFKDLNQITIEDCEILSTRCEEGKGKDWAKISHIHDRNIQPPQLYYGDENEDTDDDSVNYRDEDNDENEDKDDNSVNYRDEDSDENENKDDDSVNYRDED